MAMAYIAMYNKYNNSRQSYYLPAAMARVDCGLFKNADLIGADGKSAHTIT